MNLRKAYLIFIILFLSLSCIKCGRPYSSSVITVASVPPGVHDLSDFLEEVRNRHGLPGVTAAVFNADSIIALGAAGTRKVNSGVPLLYTDKIQIASITKTMTATIVSHLIEEGLINWHTRIAELYPELTSNMQPTYSNVTIEMLLHHSAGLPQWMRNDKVVKAWERQHKKLTPQAKRYEAVRYMLSHPAAHTPGSTYAYTNDSYLILGNICERVSGKNFEVLINEYIFSRLEMTSCGFGEPWSDESLDNPWGHVKRRSQFVPYDPEPEGYGEIPFGTPYGHIIHGSAFDLAKYGIFHLRGDLGLDSTLTSETFRKLHHAPFKSIPPANEIPAAGFFNEGRTDSLGRWFNVQHWGYYARGRTLLWFSPQANVGAVILTNGTDEDPAKGMQPISEIVIELFKRYQE